MNLHFNDFWARWVPTMPISMWMIFSNSIREKVLIPEHWANSWVISPSIAQQVSQPLFLFSVQIRSESFDQLIASSAHLAELSSTPLALPCSSASFSELRSLSPEFLTQEMLPEQSKMETETPVTYTRMKSLSHLPIDTSVPTTVSPQFTASQRTLDAVDHDHAFLYKRQPTGDTASTSEEQPGRRSSSRIQSRTTCSSSSSTSSGRAKRSKNVNRAKDIETSDDLSYYLERRRKNNEASKASRAVRRQKFESMDERWSVSLDLERIEFHSFFSLLARNTNASMLNFERRSPP